MWIYTLNIPDLFDQTWFLPLRTCCIAVQCRELISQHAPHRALNASQNDTHAILPLSCCPFHSINWGAGSQQRASEWFPPLLSSFTSYIKPSNRSWSDWAPCLISLSPRSSVNIKVLIRHRLHWVEFLVLPWYQGSAVTHCHCDDKFSFSFSHRYICSFETRTCCSYSGKKKTGGGAKHVRWHEGSWWFIWAPPKQTLIINLAKQRICQRMHPKSNHQESPPAPPPPPPPFPPRLSCIIPHLKASAIIL